MTLYSFRITDVAVLVCIQNMFYVHWVLVIIYISTIQ